MTRHDVPGATGAGTDAAEPAWRRIMRRLREGLGWNRIYRSTSYLRSALWVVPILAVVAERVTYRVLNFLDQWVTWDLTGLTVDGARALFQTLITLTLSFIVFSFGSLLVALQVASAQLTPRIIATTLLRDKVIKYSVGLNVFTLLFAVSGLNRTDTEVFQLATFFASLLGIACLASFLFLHRSRGPAASACEHRRAGLRPGHGRDPQRVSPRGCREAVSSRSEPARLR